MEILSSLLRWVHIIAGITWIGLLYYFNWMNGHIAATFDAETKKKVVPELMPRVLYWFRWGAAYTWVTGILLLGLVFYHGKIVLDGIEGWNTGAYVMVAVALLGVFVYDALFKVVKAKQPAGFLLGLFLAAAVIFGFQYYGGFTYRAMVIHLGVLFGTCMAFNVWFRIWPAQQKIIRAIKNGEAPDGNLAALAGLRSKHNTYMSVPLVWTMINAHHPGLFQAQDTSAIFLVAAVFVGWIVVYGLYKKGAQVKGF